MAAVSEKQGNVMCCSNVISERTNLLYQMQADGHGMQGIDVQELVLPGTQELSRGEARKMLREVTDFQDSHEKIQGTLNNGESKPAGKHTGRHRYRQSV